MEIDKGLFSSFGVVCYFFAQFYEEILESIECEIWVMPEICGTKTLDAFVHFFPVILQSVKICHVSILAELSGDVKFPIHNCDDYKFCGLKHITRKLLEF